MTRLQRSLQFYIGCDTNKGKLIGVNKEMLLIQADSEIIEYNIEVLGKSLFLLLQQLSDLSEDESKELIQRGIAIGRPNGYTFSSEGFLYLTSLNVDLFGLVRSGYAVPIKE
jgi:hypothetical protein